MILSWTHIETLDILSTAVHSSIPSAIDPGQFTSCQGVAFTSRYFYQVFLSIQGVRTKGQNISHSFLTLIMSLSPFSSPTPAPHNTVPTAADIVNHYKRKIAHLEEANQELRDGKKQKKEEEFVQVSYFVSQIADGTPPLVNALLAMGDHIL